MKWATANAFRSVASPWLIKRFIDLKAESFASRDQIDKRPKDAIPIAIPGTKSVLTTRTVPPSPSW